MAALNPVRNRISQGPYHSMLKSNFKSLAFLPIIIRHESTTTVTISTRYNFLKYVTLQGRGRDHVASHFKTATLSLPGTLEIGSELLLTPFETHFDSSQRS